MPGSADAAPRAAVIPPRASPLPIAAAAIHLQAAGMELLSNDRKRKMMRALVCHYEALRDKQRAALGAGSISAADLDAKGAGPLVADLEEDLIARDDQLEAQQRQLEALDRFECPKVRFGRTELMMPVVTCGGMRQQQTWSKDAFSRVEDIPQESHSNFVEVMRRALRLGINHFETAWGYGSSELQFGDAIRRLTATGEFVREKVILQTKVAPKATPEDFRAALERSFELLGVDYIDLFAFHGINRDFHLDYIFGSGRNWEVIQEFVASGRVRHVGFSTHAQTDLIVRAIETGRFDYVNLHDHFIGSYTASGGHPSGGNAVAVAAAKAHDMGIFQISPMDKAGKLHNPSAKFYDLCMPDLSPIEFALLWSWTNPNAMHTVSVGAARPSDFDEPVLAAMKLGAPGAADAVARVEGRLLAAMEGHVALGSWSDWWCGGRLPNPYETETGVYVSCMVWLHALVQGWGMYDFAKDRYASYVSNGSKWDDAKSAEENVAAWGFMPGCCWRDAAEPKLREELSGRGMDADAVIAVLKEVHSWLSADAAPRFSTLEGRRALGWHSAYDQPWAPFCER